MKTILINVLAIIAGFVLGSIVNGVLVVIGPHLIPVPAGINVNDPKSLAAGMLPMAGLGAMFGRSLRPEISP